MKEGKTKINYICTDDHLAEILIKALDQEKFLEMQRKIGRQVVT